jgi:hypothetical protein
MKSSYPLKNHSRLSEEPGPALTSVENFQLVKDEILTATRGMVQNYDILREEQSDKVYFLTLKVRVKSDEIKGKIDRSQKAVTYDNALKDYSLIQSRKEKIKKYIELLKAINERPLMERYSVDYTGYEIVNVGLNLKARITINPFFWDTYSKIIDVINDDCSQGNLVKLCTYFDNQLESTDQGKKYCVNTDVYPYLLHRTPVDLQFFLKKQKENKKGFFGSSGSSKGLEKYTRFIGALDENILVYQPSMYLQAEQFQSLLRQKYIKSECIAEGNLRWVDRKDDCYMFNKKAIGKMNSMPDFLATVRKTHRPPSECKLPRTAQFFHMLDANGMEIGTEFIFYNEEDIKELPSVKVNIGFAGTNDNIYFPAYLNNCERKGGGHTCVIQVK